MSEKQYYYSDENGNIHILTEEDLPKCPKNGGISPSVWIWGDKKEEQNGEHINCRCSVMSDKRFTVDGLNIQDNSIKGRLYLLEEQGGVNALCNLINGLNNKKNRLEKENEQLHQKNTKLIAKIDFLERVIDGDL